MGAGIGQGVEERKVPSYWQYGVVDNHCPECLKGSLDLSRPYTIGDGRWDVEWYSVPCNVRSCREAILAFLFVTDTI